MPQLSSLIFTTGRSVQSCVSSLALGLLIFEECQMQPQKCLYAGDTYSVTKYFAFFFLVTENISVFDK